MKNYTKFTTTIKNPTNEVRSKVAERLCGWSLSLDKEKIKINSSEPLDSDLTLISSEITDPITAEIWSNKDEGMYTLINQYTKGEKALIEKVINVCSSPFEYDELADKKGVEFADRVLNRATSTAQIFLKALDSTPDIEQIKDFEFTYQFMLDSYKVEVKLQWNYLNFEVFEHTQKEVSEWISLVESDALPF